jgi:hypothetical protein
MGTWKCSDMEKRKNNEDFVIFFKIMSGNHSDILGPCDLDL